MKIRTGLLPELTIGRFNRMRDVIDFDPPYQREGGIWNEETRATLIDTIINGLDMPKLYFEVVSSHVKSSGGLNLQYAVIDGKQRLEAVLAFLDNELTLDSGFKLYDDEDQRLGGLDLSQLKAKHPIIANRFLNFLLPVVAVKSDSGDLIEEMFQRLNASSALNAAERRNAISGSTREASNRLADHDFLVVRSPIKNARYKYRELAAKFLAIEHQIDTRGHVVDTKSSTLFQLFKATHDSPRKITDAKMYEYEKSVSDVLNDLAPIFEPDDRLLGSIGTVVVYYLLFRDAAIRKAVARESLLDFEELRKKTARMSEEDVEYASPVSARVREYNVLVQSTNDGAALSRRAKILRAFLSGQSQWLEADGLFEAGGILDVPDEFDD